MLKIILWTVFSLIFLIVYSSSEKYYENSDNFNLLIYGICYPGFLISVIVLTILEMIDKYKK